MSGLDLAAIKARAESATRGPWTVDTEIDGYRAGMKTVVRGPFGKRILTVDQTRQHESGDAEANTAFAAHARSDVPALLAEVERLIAENERLRRSNPLTGPYPPEFRSELEDIEP